MRTFPNQATLTSLAKSGVRAPWYSFASENVLLRFSQSADAACTGVDTRVPANFICNNGLMVYSYLTTTGMMNLANQLYTGGDYTSGNSIMSKANSAMRATPVLASGYPGMTTGQLTSWGGYANIVRYYKNGVNETSQTLFTMPETCVNSNGLVRRIEAVIDTGNYILVALGCHEFNIRVSTIKFYLWDGSTVKRLKNIIQIPMPDTETNTSWYGHNRHCSFISAIENGKGLTIIANDSQVGRAQQFTWQSGIESDMYSILPVDPEVTDVMAMPIGLAKIGNLYYLSMYFTRPKSDKTSDRLNQYLTSSDGKLWSAGERSSYISKDDTNFHMFGLDGGYVRAAGYGITAFRSASAPGRVIDGATSSLPLNPINWKASFASNTADQLDLTLPDLTNLTNGDVVTMNIGYTNGTQYGGQMGRYAADSSPISYSENGLQPSQVTLIDEAGRKLKDWCAPLWVDRWSRTWRVDNLDAMDHLTAKTIIRDAEVKSPTVTTDMLIANKDLKITDGALYANNINDPFIGYTSDMDERDGMAYAEVEFQNISKKCLQTLAFIYGASADQFNAICFPKSSTWTGHTHTNTELKTSNLAPLDKSTGMGGFNTTARMVGLLESNVNNTFSKMLTFVNATATGMEEVYRATATFNVDSGAIYQLAIRKQGGRIQSFYKTKNNAPTGIGTSSDWKFLSQHTHNEYARQSFSSRPYWGIALDTDSYVTTTDSFSQGDIDTGLTAANNYWITATGGQSMGTLKRAWSDSAEGTSGALHWAMNDGSNFSIPLGKWFYLYAPNGQTGQSTPYGAWAYAVSKDHANVVLGTGYGFQLLQRFSSSTGFAENCYAYMLLPPTQPDFGYASSDYQVNYTSTTGGTVKEVVDPGVTTTAIQIKGRAMFIDDMGSSSAISIRMVSTDTSTHLIKSGSSGTGLAWDATNPINDPGPWSMKLNPGLIMENLPSDVGLDNEGYFKIEDEYIRYKGESFAQYGSYASGTSTYTNWTHVPTYYCVAKTASQPSQIEHWLAPGFFESATGGEDFYHAEANPINMLVEIRGKTNNTNIDYTNQIDYHVANTLPATGASNSILILDKQYQGTITQPTTGTKTVSADIVIWSGRGQLGSTKAQHPTTSPAVFYPMPLTNPPQASAYNWLMRVDCFDHYNGLFNCIQDDIKATCALAGVRNVYFRSAGTYSGVLPNSAQTVATGLADFVLDINAGLFGYSTNALRIGFRGSYLLDIGLDTTISTNDSITLSLSAPNSAISASGKRLERVTIPISDYNLGTTGYKHDIRLAVRGSFIAVEINGQPLWTFNLDRYAWSTANNDNYTILTAGNVTLQFINTQSGTVTANIPELGTEIENHTIDMQQTGSDAIGTIISERHIWSRTTQDGGLEFGQFRLRDDLGTYDKIIYTDGTVVTAMDQAGHVMMSGAEFGEWIDDAWIRQNGYVYSGGNNRFLNTVSDSVMEARLLVRLGKEQTEMKSIDCGVYPEMQPEDRCTFYTPQSGYTNHVITSVEMGGDMNGMNMSVSARKESTL